MTPGRHIILTTHAEQRLRERLPLLTEDGLCEQIDRRLQRGDWVPTQGDRVAVKVEHNRRYSWAVLELPEKNLVRVITVLKPGWRIEEVVPTTS